MGPAAAVEQAELISALREAIDAELSDRQREVLVAVAVVVNVELTMAVPVSVPVSKWVCGGGGRMTATGLLKYE